MNKETILERIALLEKERDQLVLNINAMNGAIQDCQYWLSKCEEKPPESVEFVDTVDK